VRIDPLDRQRLEDVERLALGQAFDDVEEDDVAETLERREVGERAADVAAADQGDLWSFHRLAAAAPVAKAGSGRFDGLPWGGDCSHGGDAPATPIWERRDSGPYRPNVLRYPRNGVVHRPGAFHISAPTAGHTIRNRID
jgi:hypothetical protein